MNGAMALAGWPVAAEGLGAVEAELPVEAALARAAARGDRASFARLVELHKRVVYGLCVRLLGDREEARDAAQETFVRAWTAMSTYDTAQPFAPWLLRIARNHCIDLARRRIPAARKVELDAAPEEGERRELADDAVAPADVALEQAEVARGLGAAVAALPPNYREVIHLFHVEHMSYKDIAATLEVPIGTVMTWLHRARARLREALANRPEAES
ncbi:MAG TPA: sigma-70 family RNA polymerase sigma factor [Anaeromyxobacteraceae bacterium]|nr:sigma-70 family RNA polymerase sigma factor [Anaeromyxobacteraceae bacterium]